MAAREEAMVAAALMPTELALSLVEVVQSLETDLRPSECVGETGKTPLCLGPERSRGLSSRTLSTSFLKRVWRRYWMEGGQFNRHLEFWVQIWDNFWDNFNTRKY